jgi:hypothetical protein
LHYGGKDSQQTLSLVAKHRALSLVLVSLGMFTVTTVLVAGRLVTPAPVATLLLGMNFVLLGYRFIYGIIRPLPDRRLEQAKQLRRALDRTD